MHTSGTPICNPFLYDSLNERGTGMFTDARSKALVFVAHCILNQNSISDGTAIFPGSIKTVLELFNQSNIGIVQMPCPELVCLGLDRGNRDGSSAPVLVENTRIRKMMTQRPATTMLDKIIQDLIFQIVEYRNYGFNILGIIGINRSPSCGVETTSNNNAEIKGKGVFISELHRELCKNKIQIRMSGIKASEPETSVAIIQNLINV